MMEWKKLNEKKWNSSVGYLSATRLIWLEDILRQLLRNKVKRLLNPVFFVLLKIYVFYLNENLHIK